MSSIACANRFIIFAVFHPSLCFLFLNSAALDLAHIYQTSPRASFATRTLETRDKSSKWPQFAGSTHPDRVALRADRRTVMNPNLTLSAPSNDVRNGKLNTVSASATPHVQQHPQLVSHPTLSQLSTSHCASIGESAVNAGDLQASLEISIGLVRRRVADVQFGGLDDTLQVGLLRSSAVFISRKLIQCVVAAVRQWNGLDGNGYNSYGFEAGGRSGANAGANAGTGSTALYHHNGSRYGLGLPARTNTGAGNSKMNGLYGPKHKHGDMNHEFNRFARTCLEDLQGEIPALCKDQHSCWYLQRKLEEGSAEHRDMIFHETFGHFADLMTDPFGNYLCQKLLEYHTPASPYYCGIHANQNCLSLLLSTN
ncbi:hypothetical protein DFH08DRAFT_1018172 [Mycena albidolilacea]|uniref:PUM-HD domain-containing protein n=1 Tax=Mycena albidolilacea TaxID=1033008 RepID=A0AAD7ELD7_9AGAR|nr:hypothetical protein DFH08DRAFT_1018172 [Mycena albidolilacea]